MTSTQPVITIRAAAPGDAAAIAALAQLDSAPVPRGALVTVWSGGRLLVALSRDEHTVIADPFARTKHLVAMAREHAADLAPRHTMRARRGLRPRLTTFAVR
ncbi:MAG: hypothetical protein J7513_10940 [Solirubrobacteraceae bacterium]|nr:hypothetical protein [Solirubrobacteraceae bacterium]